MLTVGCGHRILATVPITELVGFLILVPRHHKHGLEYVSEAALCTGTWPHASKDQCEPKSPVEIKCPQIALRDVVRSVVSHVSELHRCSRVYARHHQTLCSRDSATNTVRTLTSQGAISSACEHSWAEQTTGPRTMWLRVSIHVSDPLDTGAARIRTGDKGRKTRAGSHSQQTAATAIQRKHSMNGFHVAPIPSPNVRSIVPRLAPCD